MVVGSGVGDGEGAVGAWKVEFACEVKLPVPEATTKLPDSVRV